MKTKKCRDCGKAITSKSKDAIVQNGYLLACCRPCKRIESRKYVKKKKEALKGTWFESQY
tara:strand:- start:364 stop:543 length:180 start_codon:yes stop_codon:yes gene_type:complete